MDTHIAHTHTRSQSRKERDRKKSHARKRMGAHKTTELKEKIKRNFITFK